MAEQKFLNTRVQLKYDSYAEWTSKNPTLLAGEIAIAKLVNDVTTPVDTQKNAPVLFKVGPGQFNDLPWASALAADVHAWAKETGLTINKDGTGNVVSNIVWDANANNGKGGIKFETASVATSEGLQSVQEAIKAIQDDIAANRDDWAEKTVDTNTDTQYRFATNGDKLEVYKTVYTLGVAGEEEAVGTYEFLSAEEVNTILTNYYTKEEVNELIQGVRDDIPTELGVMSVTGKEAIVATGDSEVEISLTLDNSGNVVLSQSNTGLKATIDLSEYRKIVDDEDTKYGLTYDSDAKQIKIVPNGGESYIDASEFVVDGMLESVVADQTANTLTFTWNTDGNKTTTTVALSEIADIYTGVDGTTIKVEVSSDNKVSAEVKTGALTDGHIAADAAIAETKLAQNVQNALALARTALQSVEHPDYTDEFNRKKDKQTIVANKITATAHVLSSLSQSENGDIAYEVKELTPADIGAQPAGDYKTKQTARSLDIGPGKTWFSISQDENGQLGGTICDIAITKSQVTDLPDYVLSVTGNEGIEVDNTDTQNPVVKVADHGIGATKLKADKDYTGDDAEVWVFYCGSASELV